MNSIKSKLILIFDEVWFKETHGRILKCFVQPNIYNQIHNEFCLEPDLYFEIEKGIGFVLDETHMP